MERPLVLVDRIDFEAEDPKFAACELPAVSDEASSTKADHPAPFRADRAAGCQFLASDWIFSAGHDPEGELVVKFLSESEASTDRSQLRRSRLFYPYESSPRLLVADLSRGRGSYELPHGLYRLDGL